MEPVIKLPYEPQRQETYGLTCVSSEDSNQLASAQSDYSFLSNLKYVPSLAIQIAPSEESEQTACAGCSESSLGSHVWGYVFWRCGSYNNATDHYITLGTRVINVYMIPINTLLNILQVSCKISRYHVNRNGRKQPLSHMWTAKPDQTLPLRIQISGFCWLS